MISNMEMEKKFSHLVRNIKENTSKERKVGKDILNGLMDHPTKEILKVTYSMEMAPIFGQTTGNTKGNGKMAEWKGLVISLGQTEESILATTRQVERMALGNLYGPAGKLMKGTGGMVRWWTRHKHGKSSVLFSSLERKALSC